MGLKASDWAEKKKLLASPVVVDLRNLYDTKEMARLGMQYSSLGRPAETL